jgi:hypothetical protein
MVLGRALDRLRSALLIGGALFAATEEVRADGNRGKGAKNDRPAVGKVERPKPAATPAPAQAPPSRPAPQVERPRPQAEPRREAPSTPQTERPRPQTEPRREAPSTPQAERPRPQAEPRTEAPPTPKVERPVREERPRADRPVESRPKRTEGTPEGTPDRPQQKSPTEPAPRPHPELAPARPRREREPALQPADDSARERATESRPLRDRLREVHVDRDADRTVDATRDLVRRDKARAKSELRTLEPEGEVPPSGWPSARPASRMPRLEREIATLPRPAREVAPRQPATAPVESVRHVRHVDVDIDIDVHRASHCHDDVDVAFWFGNPLNRHPCYVDPCGVQYGYVFCGSSLFWYTWRPGCSPCWRPYRYYWAPSCWWLPSYYPTYASVYVIRDDGATPPADEFLASAAAPAAVPAVDADAALRDGWTAFTAGRYADSLDLFRQAVLSRPDEPFAKLALAQACFAIGNYADAAFLVRRAASLLPDWPILADDPRGHYGDPADHFEQMVALRAFLERVPGEPAATLVLAVQAYFTGDLVAARDAFSELLRLDPTDPVADLFAMKLGLLAPPGAMPASIVPTEVPPAPDGR